MSIIQNLISELREKRLWPVAAALVVALIAIPVFLSSGSAPVVAAPAPVPGSATVPALPAVSVTTTPSNARITGPARNPFTQQVKQSTASSGAGTTTASGSSASKGSSTSTTSTTSTTSSGSSASSGSSTGSGTGTPTTTTPSTALPAPTSLTATQSYHVTISMTTAAGGVDTIDPVDRLSVLPSNQQPLLIELGVLQGGQRVMFLVQPGTVVRGAGTCTPGPIDCEIISLAPNQIEGLFKAMGTGVSPVAQLAVTAIKVDHHPSRAAADGARLAQSAFGRSLLDRSTLDALSLFAYKPGIGAVADLRNLIVGGS